MSENNIHISDLAFEEVGKFLEATSKVPPTGEESYAALQEVILNAAAFYQIFSASPFLFESVHNFEALIFREGKLNHILNLRMVLSGDKMFIRSPDECPVDELYEVRKVIAESHFAEFQPHDNNS